MSLKEDDPYTIELPRALEVIRLKQEADANRIILDFADAGVQVLNGRFGPYITDKAKNAKIPKDRDPKTLTLEECQALLAAAPARGGRFGRGKAGARTGAKAGAKNAKAAVKGGDADAAAAAATEAAAPKAKKAPAKKKAAPKKKAAAKKTTAKKKSPGAAD